MAEKLTALETKILKAVKDGAKTIEEIAAKSKQAESVCILITGALSRKNQVRKNPNTKEFTATDPSKLKDKVVCYGNIMLPVRFMKKPDGTRFAVRGETWNEIGEDVTEDDIIWEDNSEETTSKKSAKEPKKRDHMVNPVERVVLPSKFQQWLTKPLVKNTLKGEYHMLYKDKGYLLNLIVNESRDGLTSVEGGLRASLGMADIEEYPVLKKNLLVPTKDVEAFVKDGVPFITLEMLLAKPDSRTVYFPVAPATKSSKVNRSATGVFLEFTMKLDDPQNLTWRTFDVQYNKDGTREPLKRIKSSSGTLDQCIKENGLKPLIAALKTKCKPTKVK